MKYFYLLLFLLASNPAFAAPLTAPAVVAVVAIIASFTTMILTVGTAMLTVNIIVRLLSKPKRAG